MSVVLILQRRGGSGLDEFGNPAAARAAPPRPPRTRDFTLNELKLVEAIFIGLGPGRHTKVMSLLDIACKNQFSIGMYRATENWIFTSQQVRSVCNTLLTLIWAISSYQSQHFSGAEKDDVAALNSAIAVMCTALQQRRAKAATSQAHWIFKIMQPILEVRAVGHDVRMPLVEVPFVMFWCRL